MIESQLPEAFEVALSEVARSSGLFLHKYEYHGVEVRELRRWEGNTLRKLQANQGKDQRIEVIIRKDVFKNYQKLRIWLHNNIPMFPYTAEIKWKVMNALELGLSVADYEKILSDFIKSDV
jgi:hypothetical protein